jgi:hypothetical protein
MGDLFKAVKYYILVGYLALTAFLVVFYYDKPVHDELSFYMNDLCISSSMGKISKNLGPGRQAFMKLLREPVSGYCDCFMPSPQNQMTYWTFAKNYWENLGIAMNIKRQNGQYAAVMACAADFQAALALLAQYQ